MPTGKSLAGKTIFQLKVTLKGSKPPIWRRIQVVSDVTLYKLHQILQMVMGWQGYHMHQFIAGRVFYGQPDPEFDMDVVNERRAKLNEILLQEKNKFTYEYDFGDSWEHEILLEKILPPDPKTYYPVCLTGKRNCPPEDCGGVWGYAGLLEAIADPNHPEHADLVEWVGEGFDPEEFELEEINAGLKQIR